MKITIAKDAGYCFGVRDAVNMAYDAADKHGNVYMLGSVVHNEHVVEDLGSTNGTYLNRQKVSSATTLKTGDHLQIGSTVFEVMP